VAGLLLWRCSRRLGRVTILWLFSFSVPSSIHLGFRSAVRSQLFQRDIGIQIAFIRFQNLQWVQSKAIRLDLLVGKSNRLIANHILVVQIVILFNESVHQLRRSIFRNGSSLAHLLKAFALLRLRMESRIFLFVVPVHILVFIVLVRGHGFIFIIKGRLDRFTIRTNIIVIVIVLREEVTHLLFVYLRVVVTLDELLQSFLMERDFAILCDFLNFLNLLLDFLLLEVFQSLQFFLFALLLLLLLGFASFSLLLSFVRFPRDLVSPGEKRFNQQTPMYLRTVSSISRG